MSRIQNELNEGLLRHSDRLVQEDDEGAIEYKWRLCGMTEQRLLHLMTQMQFRVREGGGECLYELGVADDGEAVGLSPSDFEESLQTLRDLARRSNFTLVVLHTRVVADTPVHLRCAEVKIKRFSQLPTPVRVAVVGETAAGKSTLVSVMANGDADDGAGGARQAVFNHKHELETGETSSVGKRLVGFGRDGHVVNYEDAGSGTGYTLDAMERCHQSIMEHSAAVVALLDLPGHPKRRQTELAALLGRAPQAVCVTMATKDASDGVGLRHVARCVALGFPFFIVLTKHDMIDSPLTISRAVQKIGEAVAQSCPQKATQVESHHTPMSSPRAADVGCFPTAPSMDFLCDSETESVDSCWVMESPEPVAPVRSSSEASPLAHHIPIFVVSSVTSHGISALKRFLFRLSNSPLPGVKAMVPEAVIRQNSPAPSEAIPPCLVLGCGGQLLSTGETVLFGTVSQGVTFVKSEMYLGPLDDGTFHPVTVQSIQVERLFVESVAAGVDASIALASTLPTDQLMTLFNRKGTVLTTSPRASRTVSVAMVEGALSAEAREVVVMAQNMRQTARIVAVDGRVVTLFLKKHPEALRVGATAVLLRHNGESYAGTVIAALPDGSTSSLEEKSPSPAGSDSSSES